MDSPELKQKKYNETIAFMWLKESGNYISMEVDDIVLDKLQGIQKGDKIMLKLIKTRTKETSPHAALEKMDREAVKAFVERRARGEYPQQRNPSPAAGTEELSI